MATKFITLVNFNLYAYEKVPRCPAVAGRSANLLIFLSFSIALFAIITKAQ